MPPVTMMHDRSPPKVKKERKKEKWKKKQSGRDFFFLDYLFDKNKWEFD